jgi:DNA-binding MarR family transcriptional regulator
MAMAASTRRQLPADRLAIGQLLVRLLYHFRTELFSEPERETDFADLRFPHMQIWGNVGVDGIRLTELANRANLSLAACSELVNDLQALGYLERRADPADGRAKLIVPTPRGRRLLERAGLAVARLEQRWRSRCPPTAFDTACDTLDQLLRSLEPTDPT